MVKVGFMKRKGFLMGVCFKDEWLSFIINYKLGRGKYVCVVICLLIRRRRWW